MEPNWLYEDRAHESGYMRICGVDEAGRGSLAGPVVAASVILDRRKSWEGVRDSKLLSARMRRELFEKIVRDSIAWSVGVDDSDDIDRFNVLNATIHAMKSAIVSMDVAPDFILIDCVRIPGLPSHSLSIIRGDRASFSIAAASIVAKVYRDSLMEKFHRLFPEYNFFRNKGYGTREHLEVLSATGPCSIHRRTFRGVLGREKVHQRCLE